MIKSVSERYKIIVISLLILISFFFVVYFHFILHSAAVFTHFFYIPIILASIWWGRRGILIALALSLSLVLSNIFLHEYFSTADDYIRVLMFFAIAAVVSYLSERAGRIRERLHHLNLVLGAIRDINHLITKEKERDRLLKGICVNLVKNRSYFFAWIALFDDSGRLTSAAEAGLGGNFQPMADMLMHGTMPLCVTRATNTRGIILTRDPRIECAGCPLSSQSAGSSRMTVSISYGGKLRGILSVSMPEDLLYDSEEQVLFREIAADIEFALSGIELRGDHEAALGELKESEERFRNIVENAPFGYYRVDRDGLFQYVNAEWERILGFARNDVVGRHFSIAQPPREAAEQKELMARVLAGGTARGESGMMRKDGSIAFQTYNIQPVYYRGAIVGAEGFLNDITERKNAERARERTQRMLSQIIEGSPIPTFVIDENHVITHWNRACEILTGSSSEKMVGTRRQWEPFYKTETLSLADMIMYSAQNPDLARKYGGEYKKSPVLEGAANSERFFPHLGKWLFFTAALLRDSERNIIGAVETLQDTTQRKKAEEEKIRAFTELEQIFNSTPVGMRVIDREFNTIHINRRCREMFNLDSMLFPGGGGDDGATALAKSDRLVMKRIINGERYVEYEIKSRVNDEDIICIVHASPYLSNEGQIIGVIENYTNITEMRNLQNGIMQIAGLERQRIGQDLHDGLGQNLTAVTFLIEALKEKMPEKLSNEVREIEHVESLIRDAIVQTRSLSRMLSPVEMEKNGLRSALDEMAAATEKVYHVSCQIYQEGNFLISDNQTATHLYYIAREAVTNSIKHGKAERIMIRLTADDAGLAMIIRDNGTGAAKEKKDTGLGLRIMRYRAAVIGADFGAGNHEQGGFEVRVQMRAASRQVDSGKPE